MRQDLQDVAEGVAASVLQSATSNPDLSTIEQTEYTQEEEVRDHDVLNLCEADSEVLNSCSVIHSII